MSEPPEVPPTSSEPKRSPALAAGREVIPAKVLVVDDNELNRDVLSRRLERQGYRVVTAEDGLQALDRLRESEYDTVLLDIMMPRMDGYQVLEKMKADESLKHIPVIMITAVDAIESVVRCIQIGADDYLAKPFNKDILEARLRNCLEKKRLRDQEAALLSELQVEKKKSDDLLRVILPETIVDELKATNQVRPRRYENVAVLFCDIVGFTAFCDGNEPEQVVSYLQDLTAAFEDLALENRVQKIKTIGDAFMAASGLLNQEENPVANCVRFGLGMAAASKRLPPNWEVRIGIHVGSVVAGVIGRRQYLFDLWGDTVNTAQRVESAGAANAVNVSSAAWEKVNTLFQGQSLGRVQAKGKGEIEIFRIAGTRP